MITVLGLLENLGNTSEEVAKTLYAEGVKGVRGDPCNCPVANYLRHTLGNYWSVSEKSVYFAIGGERAAITPRAVELFIVDFDDEMYPDLDSEQA